MGLSERVTTRRFSCDVDLTIKAFSMRRSQSRVAVYTVNKEFAKLPEPCSTERPELRALDELEHVAACHFAEEVAKVKPDDMRPAVTT